MYCVPDIKDIPQISKPSMLISKVTISGEDNRILGPVCASLTTIKGGRRNSRSHEIVTNGALQVVILTVAHIKNNRQYVRKYNVIKKTYGNTRNRPNQ